MGHHLELSESQTVNNDQNDKNDPENIDVIQALTKQFQDLEKTYELERQETMTDQQLLQNMATIGIAVSTMSHELMATTRKLPDTLSRLQKRLKQLNVSHDTKINRYTNRLTRYGRTLRAMVFFTLGHARRDKRTYTKVNINQIIQILYKESLHVLCQYYKTQLTLSLGNIPSFKAFPYEIESIIMNFVTNALSALQRGSVLVEQRCIEIETFYDFENHTIVLVTRDNGIGIPKKDINRIFDTLYSTKIEEDDTPTGSGLGLAIVKNIVEGYNIGKRKATINVNGYSSKLGGAEFIVSFPVQKQYQLEVNHVNS